MKCFGCGKFLDASVEVYGNGDCHRPEPGDISMCVYCGHLMGFNTDGKFRELTDEEMYEIAGNPRMLNIQRARAAAIKAEKK